MGPRSRDKDKHKKDGWASSFGKTLPILERYKEAIVGGYVAPDLFNEVLDELPADQGTIVRNFALSLAAMMTEDQKRKWRAVILGTEVGDNESKTARKGGLIEEDTGLLKQFLQQEDAVAQGVEAALQQPGTQQALQNANNAWVKHHATDPDHLLLQVCPFKPGTNVPQPIQTAHSHTNSSSTTTTHINPIVRSLALTRDIERKGGTRQLSCTQPVPTVQCEKCCTAPTLKRRGSSSSSLSSASQLSSLKTQNVAVDPAALDGLDSSTASPSSRGRAARRGSSRSRSRTPIPNFLRTQSSLSASDSEDEGCSCSEHEPRITVEQRAVICQTYSWQLKYQGSGYHNLVAWRDDIIQALMAYCDDQKKKQPLLRASKKANNSYILLAANLHCKICQVAGQLSPSIAHGMYSSYLQDATNACNKISRNKHQSGMIQKVSKKLQSSKKTLQLVSLLTEYQARLESIRVQDQISPSHTQSLSQSQPTTTTTTTESLHQRTNGAGKHSSHENWTTYADTSSANDTTTMSYVDTDSISGYSDTTTSSYMHNSAPVQQNGGTKHAATHSTGTTNDLQGTSQSITDPDFTHYFSFDETASSTTYNPTPRHADSHHSNFAPPPVFDNGYPQGGGTANGYTHTDEIDDWGGTFTTTLNPA
eukprot:TRINITY_DN66468_c10_g1_i1.p1 TRINITY_DN66468_c10_g1~~TRINITY_DN66468_c10_g1_i1.p1  ORF type:complete len:649 (+),score=41.78 TRINITY_DN66468_c10_g1_i1:62-2008(+)